MGSLPPIFRWKTSFVPKSPCEQSPQIAELLLRSIDPSPAKFAFEMPSAGSFCFPKNRRLTHRSEYECVKQRGTTQRGKFLILNVMSVESSGPWRAGFVTSGRLGGAVVRNRVRRRLREIVRRHQHELQQAVWFVIIARYEAATATYDALEDEWLRLAKRASILL